ncbi:hypothetical protein ACTMTJ_17920 [Phytohabitans sp. LJ34]|uniref:hypothetical protein n=1 Tax=Phytohabitans sp. LJ34 TaxID=3452217 RepID=UPI003F8889F4
MTADREREGIDRLRVGGWLSPARSRFERGDAPDGPAHAAPDDDEPDRQGPEWRQLPAAYEAPPVDFDAPVSAVPHRRAAPERSRTFDARPGVAQSVGRYVYQGRRHLSEMMANTPRRQRARFALAGVALVVVAIAAVAMLSPDRGTGPGPGLALPTGPPQLPPPSADQGIGSASPEPPSPSPSRTTPPSKSPPARPPSSRPGPLTISYEAEGATLVGGAQVAPLSDASGGRIVHNIGSAPGRQGGLVSFTDVVVPTTNRYALTVDYVTAEERTAVLIINGDTSLRLRFPSSGGWEKVASRTFTIQLVGGRNNLTFGNPDGWAPRMDRISLLG